MKIQKISKKIETETLPRQVTVKNCLGSTIPMEACRDFYLEASMDCKHWKEIDGNRGELEFCRKVGQITNCGGETNFCWCEHTKDRADYQRQRSRDMAIAIKEQCEI